MKYHNVNKIQLTLIWLQRQLVSNNHNLITLENALLNFIIVYTLKKEHF